MVVEKGSHALLICYVSMFMVLMFMIHYNHVDNDSDLLYTKHVKPFLKIFPKSQMKMFPTI